MESTIYYFNCWYIVLPIIKIVCLFADLLKKSAPSRIVHVCSLLHRFGHLDFDNMNCEKGICNIISSSNSLLSHSVDTLVVYSNSKLYNLIGSSEFARRLKGTGMNIFHLNETINLQNIKILLITWHS